MVADMQNVLQLVAFPMNLLSKTATPTSLSLKCAIKDRTVKQSLQEAWSLCWAAALHI
jgi:hypothetical protein